MPVEGWVKKPLGELLVLEYGAGLPQAMRTDEGYPVYGSGGLVGRHSEYLVRGPGIVVGRKGTVGAVIWSKEPFWPIDTTYYVQARNAVDLRWTFWLLSSLPLGRLDSSTGVPGLNRHDAYAINVTVPPLPEQRRIADILDTADEAIWQTERLIAKLKAVKAGLLHDLLTRGLDEHGHLRDPQAHPEQFKDSPLGRIPREWTIRTLDELTDSAVDGPFGSNLKTEHYVSQPGVRVVRLQNVESGHFDDTDKAYISEAHARDLRRHEVVAGDLLVASLGDQNHPIARSCLYPAFLQPGIVKADCFRFRLRRSLAIHAYIMYVLNCPPTRDDVDLLGHGVTRDRVTLTTLLQVRVRVPPTVEQSRIIAVLDAHDARIRAEEATLDKLRQVKRGLMDDLLTGRVRVRLEVLTEEEKLVAELGLLGIHYLSRQSPYQATQVRPPEVLLADLVRQPSARVRAAVIAVLLSHPEYAEAVPAALKRLRSPERLTLQSFYTAAVLLQQEHAKRLQPFLATRWQWLPDLFSTELGLPAQGTPRERLVLLGHRNRHRTKAAVNWVGTYAQVVHKLLRHWEKETQWNQ